MKPKTVLQWHEHAFLQWWRWQSRRKGGRPTICHEMRALIRRLSRENVLWSAETIHGHLVLLGFDPPCPDTIRKYMVKHLGGTDKSQGWLTFLRNHLQVSWAMDFFTVPTLRFQILYIFVILNHSRRQVVHFAVTAHPTMAWVIQQLREAMPFGQQLCLANCNFASQRACHNVTSPRRMLFISKAFVILAKHSRKHPCNNALRSLYLVDFKFGQSFSGATIPSVSFRRNSSEFRERQYSSRVSQRRLQLVRGSALLLRLP